MPFHVLMGWVEAPAGVSDPRQASEMSYGCLGALDTQIESGRAVYDLNFKNIYVALNFYLRVRRRKRRRTRIVCPHTEALPRV